MAGVVFAVLFAATLVLFRTAMPRDAVTSTAWAQRNADRITAATVLMPFAGIAFLWFIAVVRDRLGDYEDRFFATVLLGSGLLLLAMTFIAVALTAAMLSTARSDRVGQPAVLQFGRDAVVQLSNVYAARMAGVFMISFGTIGHRTQLMPRWLVVATFVPALALLVVITVNLWVTLIFPLWVLILSVYFLVEDRHGPPSGLTSLGGPPGAA